MNSLKILSAQVENKPGTLFKMTNLARLLHFNIEGVAIGTTSRQDISRVIFTLNATDRANMELLVKQTSKLIDVLDVSVYSPSDVIARELALIEVKASDAILDRLRGIPECRVVGSAGKTVILEAACDFGKVDEVLEKIGRSEVLSLARTGVIALPKRSS
ncbi:MAG: acetolactate synthase small subunit [Nitrososphaerota archaeon]|nr:acetolactate synthase small subunit [Nitrososphaerota archaeon]MDG6940025.1 acetolactate synthase small subunit [Nitrososphaerota archaeon]